MSLEYEPSSEPQILLPSDAGYLEGEGMEKTQRFQQHKIKAEVDGASAQKIFTLRLDDLGPYPPIQSPTFPHHVDPWCVERVYQT